MHSQRTVSFGEVTQAVREHKPSESLPAMAQGLAIIVPRS